MVHAAPVYASWLSLLPSEIPETKIESWKTMSGDSLVVDTKLNIGYLVHAEGGYTSFPVVTGQKRVVKYIGRTYNASTPNKHWKILSKERKGRSITFGEDGTFLRLYDEGESTSYGIHSHLSIETMLDLQDRYRSMGCILVSEEILDIIEQTFLMNRKELSVITIGGFGDEPMNFSMLKEVLEQSLKS